MKKILALFMFLMSFSLFAWETVEIVDEFREPTGKIRIIQYDSYETSWFFVDKADKGYSIGFRSDEFIGGDKSVIKIKIDSENPEILNGYVWSNNHIISTYLPNHILEKMKIGNTMKVLIKKYDEQTILLKFNLNGFTEQLKKVK